MKLVTICIVLLQFLTGIASAGTLESGPAANYLRTPATHTCDDGIAGDGYSALLSKSNDSSYLDVQFFKKSKTGNALLKKTTVHLEDHFGSFGIYTMNDGIELIRVLLSGPNSEGKRTLAAYHVTPDAKRLYMPNNGTMTCHRL